MINLELILFELLLQLLHISLRDTPSFSLLQALKDIIGHIIISFIYTIVTLQVFNSIIPRYAVTVSAVKDTSYSSVIITS